jgi:hypothetical protein
MLVAAEQWEPVPAVDRVQRLANLQDAPAPLLLPSGTTRHTLTGDSKIVAATLE